MKRRKSQTTNSSRKFMANEMHEKKVLEKIKPMSQASHTVKNSVQDKVMQKKMSGKSLEKVIVEYYSTEYDKKKNKKIPSSELRRYIDIGLEFKELGIKSENEVINAINMYEMQVKKLGAQNLTIDELKLISHGIIKIYKRAKGISANDLRKNPEKIRTLIEDEVVQEYIKEDSETNRIFIKKLEDTRKKFKSKIADPITLEEERVELVAQEKAEIKLIKQERLTAIKSHNNDEINSKVNETMQMFKMIKGI